MVTSICLHARQRQRVAFDMSNNGIEEEIAEEAYLFIGGYGQAVAQSGASTIAAQPNGTIDYCVLKSDPAAVYPWTQPRSRACSADLRAIG
jgi:hypothetical protein